MMEKEREHKERSKQRLKQNITKRIRTTMIGALDSVERTFGHLWAMDENRPLTVEEEKWYDWYAKLRSEILTKGNNQIRAIEDELEEFDVEWHRYIMTLPVRRREN